MLDCVQKPLTVARIFTIPTFSCRIPLGGHNPPFKKLHLKNPFKEPDKDRGDFDILPTLSPAISNIYSVDQPSCPSPLPDNPKTPENPRNWIWRETKHHCLRSLSTCPCVAIKNWPFSWCPGSIRERGIRWCFLCPTWAQPQKSVDFCRKCDRIFEL